MVVYDLFSPLFYFSRKERVKEMAQVGSSAIWHLKRYNCYDTNLQIRKPLLRWRCFHASWLGYIHTITTRPSITASACARVFVCSINDWILWALHYDDDSSFQVSHLFPFFISFYTDNAN